MPVELDLVDFKLYQHRSGAVFAALLAADIYFGPEKERKNMAKSVNKVILLGNVGKDPEIRSTGGGTMVANFTLATSDRFQDAQGNWQDRTEWHNLVAFKRPPRSSATT